MPQFDVSTFGPQLFWLFLVFMVLYLIVSRLIAPAAETILTSRNRFIQDNVESADEYNRKSAEIEKFRENKLTEVNVAAEDIRHKALKKLSDEFEHRRLATIDELKLKTNRAINDTEIFADNFHSKESEPCLQLAAHIINKVTGKPANMTLLEKIEKDYHIVKNDDEKSEDKKK